MGINRTFIFLFLIVCFFSTSAFGCDLELLKMKICGVRVNQLTIDKITNILGRPTVVERHNWDDKSHNTVVKFHNHGLKFDFSIRDDGKTNHVHIYLAKIWDKDASEFYSPFSGKITRGVNANWKINKIMEEFKNYEIKNVENTQEMLSFMKEYGLAYNCATIRDNDKNIFVNFNYEPETKFLEEIFMKE